MIAWATKRKILYSGAVFGAFAAIAVSIYYIGFYRPPSCNDGSKNQGEEGPDCGGPCSVVCPSDVSHPIVLWNRSFASAKGVYNAIAYVENPNPDLGVEKAVYHFKLYDANNVLVSERTGQTFIAPNERFAVFEPRIITGERVPARTFFEFLTFSDWVKFKKEKPKMLVRGEKAVDWNSSPRIDAILQNGTIADIPNIDVVAIAYDISDNAIGTSATRIDKLLGDASYNLAFTWSDPFPSAPARIEIIPRIDLFDFSI